MKLTPITSVTDNSEATRYMVDRLIHIAQTYIADFIGGYAIRGSEYITTQGLTDYQVWVINNLIAIKLASTRTYDHIALWVKQNENPLSKKTFEESKL